MRHIEKKNPNKRPRGILLCLQIKKKTSTFLKTQKLVQENMIKGKKK